MKVIGLATASHIEGRPWAPQGPDHDAVIETACPGRTYTQIPGGIAARAVLESAQRISPRIVAINGYRMADSRALLRWCRANEATAILMSESKGDDATRFPPIEWIKRMYVSQFDAGLCGGAPHREYLMKLGMAPNRIFDRYDVVDNAFFAARAEVVRRQPAAFRKLPGLTEPRPFFLACSRLIPRKNLRLLIQAFGIYRSKSADGWRLVILGIGPEEAALRQQVKKWGVPDVVFSGFMQVADLVPYYALAGAFIHPALQEQWGLVLNEAMACGLPVLVSATVGAAHDLVREGVNGFKFDPNDARGLAERMLEMSALGHSELAGMGASSRRIIADWSPERFAQSFWAAAFAGRALRSLPTSNEAAR